MRFDLTDLRLFLAVVDAGSITHGAADVGLSLPAASERLRDMEANGGVKLLERGRRGITPTPAGEALAHHARLIQRQMAQMHGELGEHASGLRATVRLAANTAAIAEFLPQRLAGWMAGHPRIDIELKERQSIEIARAVSAGLAEIGILSDAVDTSGLMLRPFAIDRLVLVMPRDHALAAAKQIAFADLLHEHFVGLASGALQDHIDAQAARLGTRLKMRVRMRTFESICEMAACGIGLGIVPETAARRCGRSTKIAALRLTDDWATRQLSVCTRSAEELAPPARDLFEHLAAK
ncbi:MULTISPECIES: LysR family transcriptional regulator [Rhizobium]|uniref:LysR family transcriptional regulator n=1 Tax=Rhizobium TaxID=379 RepID=UPI00195B04EF|nr:MULTISPECIES: LysR family transcriptional regulator [Rhizobium]MBM7044189.1 LysR family transcriptional regulator [Rhizobium lusitanum]